jgi:hypothetical protein
MSANKRGRFSRRGLPWQVRLWGNVEFGDGCWRWLGGTSGGYGKVQVDGRQVPVHRLAYEFAIGPIPPGLVLDHLCRNTRCVRPEHLEAVSTAENILRGNGPAARNARKERCPRGHLYSDANTYVTRTSSRQCLACRSMRTPDPEVSRRATAKWKRANPNYQERANARRRERYATDPAYRERVRTAVRARRLAQT